MKTFEEFSEDVMTVQQGLVRDYREEDGTAREFCEILHEEVGLDKTPLEDAEERSEQIKETMNIDVPADSIKLTQEHFALHQWLNRLVVEAGIGGLPITDLVAAAFVQGRRYGMREAALALAQGDGSLSDITDLLDGGDDSPAGV